jgi:hypothetical protein
VEVKFTQQVVVFGHWSFSFEDLDGDSLLVIGVGGKDLRFLGRDFVVSWDDFSHNSSDSLDTKGQRNNVQKDNVLTQGLVST